MFSSIVTTVTSSSAITLALFYLMQLLISLQPAAAVEVRDRHELAWTVVKRKEETFTTQDRIPPKEFIKPPPTPETPSQTPSDPVNTGVHYGAPPPGPREVTGPTGYMTDGPLVAIIRVAPTYPAAAAQREIEGYVIVQFDVNPDGTVVNAVVIESSNRIFENSALKAISRFRFKPRVAGGVPQATRGMQNLFRFEMEE